MNFTTIDNINKKNPWWLRWFIFPFLKTKKFISPIKRSSEDIIVIDVKIFRHKLYMIKENIITRDEARSEGILPSLGNC